MSVINKVDKLVANPVEVFGKALVELAEKDERVVFVSADSCKGGGAAEFKERFPDRFFEFGICEQNAASASGGLAWAGYKPFWSTIATFATMRCFEQIRDDIVRPKLNVAICGRAAGLSYSTQGPTHLSIDEIGILRTLPGMIVVAPADDLDMRNTVFASVQLDGPIYLRKQKMMLPRVNPEGYEFKFGKGVVLKEGSDLTIIGCGSMVNVGLKVSESLSKDKIDAAVINMHTIKPIDKDLVVDFAKKTNLIVTLEEHTVFNGLGSAVADVLSTEYPTKLIKFGFNDEWPVDGGIWEEVMDFHGLSAEKISGSIKFYINKFRK